MHELPQHIPDVEVLLSLEPEELAAKLLFLVRQRFLNGNFSPSDLLRELWDRNRFPGQELPYPRNREAEIQMAFAEVWAWLTAQGLVLPAVWTNGGDGRILSRRARNFENESDFAEYRIARMLPKGALHPRIAGTVWMAFMRSEFDVAVLQAMKMVEVAVREAANLPNDQIGIKLMRSAFATDGGPLSNPNSEKAEQEALANLFAGAIGSYKNPHSHRDVQLKDPAEAVEIIMLANHLLRIVDTRKRAKHVAMPSDTT